MVAQAYPLYGNFYLINFKHFQIGIGIGTFSIIYLEDLQIGNFRGIGNETAFCANYDGFLWVFPRKVVRIRTNSEIPMQCNR